DGSPSERDACAEKRLAAAGLGDEAHVLTVGLGGGAETESRCPLANLGLGEPPDREEGASQLTLRQHVHHVALVLGLIGATVHEATIADRFDASMMTSGNRVEPQQVG